MLLTMPSFDGTLAAVRCLGDRGIPITVAGDNRFSPARWSRHVQHFASCPSVFEPERYMDWLLEFGKRHPGHVLYPTSDDLAWLFAQHRDELSKHFRMYQPSADALLQFLDKRAMHRACDELGIPSPSTVFPVGVADAVHLGTILGYPLLIKPRTQMFLYSRDKGAVVENPSELARAYPAFVGRNPHHRLVRGLFEHADDPMLQTFARNAATNTYSISGFISREGKAVAARAATKVLQRPRNVGVGVCFEEAPLDPDALHSLVRLCHAVEYFGVFEAEFVRIGGELQLIDFNPRFYGQMAFEDARDLPLPYMAWLGAVGEEERLNELINRSDAWDAGRGYVFCNRFFLNMTLFLQGMSGAMSEGERERWRRWIEEPDSKSIAFDSSDSHGDPLPSVAFKVREVYRAVRHPRSFYRKMIVGGALLALHGGYVLSGGLL